MARRARRWAPALRLQGSWVHGRDQRMRKVLCEDLALSLQQKLFSGSLPAHKQVETVIGPYEVVGTSCTYEVMCGAPETSPSLGRSCTQAFNVLGTKMGGREGIHVPVQHHLIMRATGDAIPHPGGVTASPDMVAPLRHYGQSCSAWADTG